MSKNILLAVGNSRLGGQRHVIWRPGEADRQRRAARLRFPGGPAHRLTASGRPVIAGHDLVSHSSHGDLLCLPDLTLRRSLRSQSHPTRPPEQGRKSGQGPVTAGVQLWHRRPEPDDAGKFRGH